MTIVSIFKFDCFVVVKPCTFGSSITNLGSTLNDAVVFWTPSWPPTNDVNGISNENGLGSSATWNACLVLSLFIISTWNFISASITLSSCFSSSDITGSLHETEPELTFCASYSLQKISSIINFCPQTPSPVFATYHVFCCALHEFLSTGAVGVDGVDGVVSGTKSGHPSPSL